MSDDQNALGGSSAEMPAAADSTGWQPDPWSRFEERWTENGAWTSKVRTAGAESTDAFPAGSAHGALPAPTRAAGLGGGLKKLLIAGAAGFGVLLVIGLAAGGGKGGNKSNDAASATTQATSTTTQRSTTTTVNVDEVRQRLSKAVDTACIEQAQSSRVTDPSAGYESDFFAIDVDVNAYGQLLQSCVDRSIQSTIASAAPIAVDEVVKNPDAVKGRSFVLVSEISQYDAATGSCSFRGYWDNSRHSYTFDYAGDNAIFIAGDADSDCPVLNGIDQEDVVKLWVRSTGSFSYDTQIGGSTTVPSFYVLRAEVLEKK